MQQHPENEWIDLRDEVADYLAAIIAINAAIAKRAAVMRGHYAKLENCQRAFLVRSAS